MRPHSHIRTVHAVSTNIDFLYMGHKANLFQGSCLTTIFVFLSQIGFPDEFRRTQIIVNALFFRWLHSQPHYFFDCKVTNNISYTQIYFICTIASYHFECLTATHHNHLTKLTPTQFQTTRASFDSFDCFDRGEYTIAGERSFCLFAGYMVGLL